MKHNFLWGIRKGDLLRDSYLIWLGMSSSASQGALWRGWPSLLLSNFHLVFWGIFFFVVSHQTQLGLNKIIWGNPSTFGSHRSILCHQLGWEWPASSLFPQWKSTALNSMVTPRLYANRIKCSLLQVSIMIKYSLFFFSNWDSLQNIMGGIHCDSLSQLWYLLFSFNPFTPIFCTSHGDTNLCSCFLEKQRGSRVKIC